MSDAGFDPQGGSFPPYLPDAPLIAPPVLIWYKIYLGLMVLLALFFAGLGAFLVVIPIVEGLDDDTIPALIIGGIYIVIGLAFALLYAIPLLFSPRPWIWIYGIVLIALSMTNLCCIPLAIPLLIFWIKDDNRRWHGMQ